MACKQAAMSWIFNGAGSFEKLPVKKTDRVPVILSEAKNLKTNALKPSL